MTTPEENGLLAGTFWQVDTPDRRVPGHLKVTGQPVLDVLGRLFDERANRVQVSPTGGVTITYSGDPDDLVADFEPRTIHGELEDGTRVSIVGAQGGKKRSTGLFDMEYRQEFRTIRHVILDEHVDDRQVYASCCFSVVGPHWWRSEDGEASTSDGGRLVVTREGDTRWSEFIPLHPLTVRDFDRWVLSPIATLASLLTANRAEAVHLHVRLTDASPWRKVYREEESAPSTSHELLDASHLGADRCTRWIDFRKRSDALDAAAIDKLDGVAIQAAVLTFAAVAEGLHRRLFEDTKRVPALSPADLKHARRAARTAARERVCELDRSSRPDLTDDDLTEFENAMNDSFSFINEQTFRSRMALFAVDAQAAIPNIVASFRDWPAAVKDALNTLAHKGTEPHSETIDQFYDLLIALSYSIPWVLRTILLLQAEIDASTLREAYELSSAYNHHITNTRNLLAGGPYAAR
jgi:ApeA N-terminal domain 1